MPTAERYSRYREDQTTIWVSKTAAEFLSRERGSPGEGAAAVLDRVIKEYSKMRRASGGTSGGAAGAVKTATKSAAKSATKSAAKSGATKAAAKGAKVAKAASKSAAKTAKKTA